MSDFSKEEIKALVEEQIPPCVSMYMPIGRSEIQPLQGPTRLKTLINQAEEQLQLIGSDKQEIESVLQPVRDLLENENFWTQPRQGLAVFCSASPDAFRTFSDNSDVIEFTETVSVGDSFHLKPLIPLLTGDRSFYVLSLSQNHAGLLRGSRDRIRPMDVPDLPHNIEEALGEEVSAAELQGRPMNVSGGEQTGVFGGYDPSGYQKDRVVRYFRKVNDAVHKALAGSTAPLVIAGLAELHPVYQEANTYSYLADQGIEHDADTLTAEELHEAAWPIVAPFFDREINDGMDRYHRLAATNPGITSNKLSDILQAAHFGRVDTLFIPENYQQFGHYDPAANTLEAFLDQRPGSVDLIDQAATHVILNGGTVYTIKPEDMPDSLTHIAAIYRY